jgi:hypothetical protein
MTCAPFHTVHAAPVEARARSGCAPFDRFGAISQIIMLAMSILFFFMASPVAAQTTVTSSGPKSVSVTVYRDPNRGSGGKIDLRRLAGFALITETRSISVPAGQADIRFEGVAGGIIPVSAVVTGLPGGVVQKNRDAQLLSPAALVDGSYGKIVHLKRTSRQTGKVTEEDAEIVAGPAGGVILKTKDGIEALGCAGLPESVRYSKLPEGLTAKPTLSVTTRSPRAAAATVQLSYLASGFDWAANYVAHINPDGKTLDLFAWLTLANSNAESFARANTQAVAGRLNRVRARDLAMDAPQPNLSLECWPLDTTATHPKLQLDTLELERRFQSVRDKLVLTRGSVMDMAMPAAVASPAPMAAMQATQEELGDFKLYRIPEPVTVSANAQKQVALLVKQDVAFKHIYTVELFVDGQQSDPRPSRNLLRLKNTQKDGLGLPLPNGTTAIFETVGAQSLLLGTSDMRDSAVDEDVELQLGSSAQVQATQVRESASMSDPQVITLTNANDRPASVEVRLTEYRSGTLITPSEKLTRKNGQPLWTTTVPANGTATLTYTTKQTP